MNKITKPIKTNVLIDDINRVVVIRTPWRNDPVRAIHYNNPSLVLRVKRFLTHYRVARMERTRHNLRELARKAASVLAKEVENEILLKFLSGGDKCKT